MTQTTLREYLRTTEDAIGSGRYDEAMANCQNVLTYFPEALDAQRLLGEVYLAQNRLEEAQQTFEWILTNDPENVIVYCDRALVSERTADIDTALDCYQQAYELSRGNTKIRQAFNELSASVGQQEFMFSRAGLARLYMRGDLLTQAIQEWEAVLAVSPERLDARLGLLETYWRQGLYEKAEQTATQLLEEIPTCLKAILYLAHLTSISQVQRAKDLLQRAETLDPDLRMAREIFADLANSSPTDPFLGLFRKEPVMLENGVPVNWRTSSSPAPAVHLNGSAPHPAVQVEANGLAASSPYTDWEVVDAQPTVQTPGASQHVVPETPASARWEDEIDPMVGFEITAAESGLPSWQEQLEQRSPALEKEQPWYQEDQLLHSNNGAGSFAADLEADMVTLPDWQTIQEENALPAPPAWLDNLTQSDQGLPPLAPTPLAPTPLAQPSTSRPLQETGAVADTPFQQKNEETPFFLSSESETDEDGPSWPDWLKSLGAESLEVEQSPVAPLPTVAPLPEIEADPWAALPAISASNDDWTETASQPAQPDWMQSFSAQEAAPAPAASSPASVPDWMQQLSPARSAQASTDENDWMQQFASAPTSASESYQPATPDWMQQLTSQPGESPQVELSPSARAQEERYLTSLADLEKNLQSQGFVALTPGSLAEIAQTQQTGQPQPAPVPDDSLSSTLAQLSSASPVGQATAPGADAPWWNTQPNAAQANPFAALGARTMEEIPQQLSPLPATPRPTLAFEPAVNQSAQADANLTPAYRSDALLDSDLETTMKRPAIKLQPMQTGEHLNAASKSMPDRKPEPNDDPNMNSHERLLRGYQFQLAGAYDEAMQEYRLVIRNAPELLDDVISNIRAILKFNPRFSLGYRVLGDAYMRKGEYLQAMESYNKALTVAKKARG
jgi:tetratricopeptide (TPR) repeat protein